MLTMAGWGRGTTYRGGKVGWLHWVCISSLLLVLFKQIRWWLWLVTKSPLGIQPSWYLVAGREMRDRLRSMSEDEHNKQWDTICNSFPIVTTFDMRSFGLCLPDHMVIFYICTGGALWLFGCETWLGGDVIKISANSHLTSSADGFM